MGNDTTAIATTNGPGELVAAGLNAGQVEVVKATICAGYSDTEMMLYLY